MGLTIASDAFRILSSQVSRPTFIRAPLHKSEMTTTKLLVSSFPNHGGDFNNFIEPESKEELSPSIMESAVTPADLPKTIAVEVKPKKAVKASSHQEGIFSPVVITLKNILGEDELNKLRGKVIAMHSNVINSFIETSNTEFGKAVLVKLFQLADRNRDGELQKEELAVAVETLGFSWLKEKQISGILERADKNHNGAIDLEEFLLEAPKTLKTNLVKLAKKNGGEMGFLV